MERVLRVVSFDDHAKGNADLVHGDLDIFIRPTPENGARLLKTIRDFGFPAPELGPPVQIHIMSDISGISPGGRLGRPRARTARDLRGRLDAQDS
jgi:hypothetical protein